MARELLVGNRKGTKIGVSIGAQVRSTHMHVVGASNSGKSKFLEHLIRQDIKAGRGVCLLDPHGTLYDKIVSWCALNDVQEWRGVHLFEPQSKDWVFGFNPLRFGESRRETDFMVDSVVNVFSQVWGGSDMTQTPQLKRFLKLVLYALAVNDLTLLEARDFTAAADVNGLRRKLTADLGDDVMQSEWDDINSTNDRQFFEAFKSTNGRLFTFLSAQIVNLMIGQQANVLDVGEIMDKGDVLLVNLASGGTALSGENSHLMGSLLINDLLLKARAREEGSEPFYLYIDECYRYLNDDIEDILFEMRKFGLHLILAHQDLSQLRRRGESIYSAVMGGAQTKTIFRVGGMEDAKLLATELTAGEINYEEAKKSFISYQTVGHTIEWLDQESKTTSHTSSERISEVEGGSETTATSNSEAYDDDDDLEPRRTSTESDTSTRTSSRTVDSATSDSESDTFGRHQALRPDIRATYNQSYTLEEILNRSAGRLTKLALGEAILKIPGKKSVLFEVPSVVTLGKSSELDAQINDFKKGLFTGSSFTSTVQDARSEILKRQNRIRGEEANPGKNPDDFLY